MRIQAVMIPEIGDTVEVIRGFACKGCRIGNYKCETKGDVLV